MEARRLAGDSRDAGEATEGREVSETRRYGLTLIKVPPGQRDKFRALSRPETYKEVRPGEVGERVAYSVEMTEAEYEQARRDAEDPTVNLIAAEPRIFGEPGYSGPVPEKVALAYLAADRLAALGFDGRGVDVAICDTGLGAGLAGGVFSGRVKAAWSDVEGVDPLTDTDGHGSAMASLAVPPKARIVVARITDSQGFAADDAVARALYWIADGPGSHVVNISYQFSAGSTVLTDAVRHTLSQNVLIFACRGNYSSSEPVYPASEPGVLAITNFDRRTNNIDASSSYGSDVFAAAGGMAIWKLEPDGSAGYLENGGTSSATAFATHIAASIQTQSNASAGNVRDYLAKGAHRTGAGPLYEGAGVLSAFSTINLINEEIPAKTNLDGSHGTGIPLNLPQPTPPMKKGTHQHEFGRDGILEPWRGQKPPTALVGVG